MNSKADYCPWPQDFLCTLPGLLDPVQPERAGRLRQRIAGLRLSPGAGEKLARLYLPLAVYLEERLTGIEPPLVLGINGAQGTGKSTATLILKMLLEQHFNRRACTISIDDIYLTREARRDLARDVHPLLLTRGVPGTHDIELGIEILQSLQRANPESVTVIPRFNKAHDQPFPPGRHERFVGSPDFILFEGWCVGAVPEPPSALDVPVNELERREDGDAEWRRYVNSRLVDYQPLFEKINILAMLKAPSFEKVFEWRKQQENELAAGLSPAELQNSRVMSREELRRFMMHYERLTRWMIAEMPGRADFVFELGDDHAMKNITINIHR